MNAEELKELNERIERLHKRITVIEARHHREIAYQLIENELSGIPPEETDLITARAYGFVRDAAKRAAKKGNTPGGDQG